VTSAAAAILLCYIDLISSTIAIFILLAASVILIWKFYGLLKGNGNRRLYDLCSRLLYGYFLLVIILLIADRVKV
jgi:hypothetical protein